MNKVIQQTADSTIQDKEFDFYLNTGDEQQMPTSSTWQQATDDYWRQLQEMDEKAEANLDRVNMGTTYEELREQPVDSAMDARALWTINWEDMEQDPSESGLTIVDEKPWIPLRMPIYGEPNFNCRLIPPPEWIAQAKEEIPSGTIDTRCQVFFRTYQAICKEVWGKEKRNMSTMWNRRLCLQRLSSYQI